jgi:hypothetical protein
MFFADILGDQPRSRGQRNRLSEPCLFHNRAVKISFWEPCALEGTLRSKRASPGWVQKVPESFSRSPSRLRRASLSGAACNRYPRSDLICFCCFPLSHSSCFKTPFNISFKRLLRHYGRGRFYLNHLALRSRGDLFGMGGAVFRANGRRDAEQSELISAASVCDRPSQGHALDKREGSLSN